MQITAHFSYFMGMLDTVLGTLFIDIYSFSISMNRVESQMNQKYNIVAQDFFDKTIDKVSHVK